MNHIPSLNLVHICALIPLYQINTNKCTDILLSHHIFDTIRYCVFKPFRGHFHGVYLIHSNSKVNKMSHLM